MAEESLKNKTVKGTIWSGVDNVILTGVSFLVSVVLARLLSPDDYGLLGIILIFTTVCNAIINGGFTTAIIRKKEPTEDDYDTSFIVNLGLSLLLYIVIFLCSPLIADFFDRDELVLLTRVSTLTMVVGAFGLVQQTRLTKRIDFKTQSKITFFASIISGGIGISMAILGCGVWALVVQGLSTQIIRTSLLWFYNKWIPSLKFCKKSFDELFGFGWKMMLSSIIDSLWTQLYQLVIGKYYLPSTLGQYTRSRQFSDLLSSNLTSVIQRVSYPVLSEIQDDKERMKDAYSRIIKVTMFITFSAIFALAAISEPLLYCLIGEKWHTAATYLPLLCVIGSLYPLHAINLNMLQIQGRSDLFLGLEIVKKTIAIVPLVIGVYCGIYQMLLSSIVVGIISYFLNSGFSGKLLGYNSWMQLKDISRSFIVAVFMAIIVYFVKYLPLSFWIILPLQIIVGALILVVACRIIRLQEFEEVKTILMSIVIKIKNK